MLGDLVRRQPTCGQLVWSRHQCIWCTNLLPFTISHFLGGFFVKLFIQCQSLMIWKAGLIWPLFNIWHIIFQSFFFPLSPVFCTQLPTCGIPTSTSDAVMSELLNSQTPSCFQQQNPRWSWVLPQKFLIVDMRDGLPCCLVLPAAKDQTHHWPSWKWKLKSAVTMCFDRSIGNKMWFQPF